MNETKKTYKVVAAWKVWFWQSHKKKEFFTTNISLAEDAFDEFIKQDAEQILLIEMNEKKEGKIINEKKEGKIIKSYIISSSTTSSSTVSTERIED